MSAKSFRKMVVLALALVCISAGYVRADKLALQEKLSKDVNIKLKDVTIAKALEKIGEKAGVKFVLSDEAVWKLPQGAATRLSVTLDGPLAESMTEMLNAFFMRYAVSEDEITIYPRPELEHILGRPTATQLKLLRAIYTNAIGAYSESPQNTINEALGEYVTVVPYYALDEIDTLLYHIAGKEEFEDLSSFELPGPMTVANMLEHIGRVGRRTGFMAEWYLLGVDFPEQVPEIRLVSEDAFREAKLDQIVDISFKEKEAEAIIQRLANWTGMRLHVAQNDPSWNDPSWLDAEIISVDMQNVKLQQALLNIVSSVNGVISIDIGDNTIFVSGPKHRRKPVPRATTAARSSPSTRTPVKAGSEGYVGKISIPMDGGKYYIEFMLREKDLTEELKQLREKKMKEILGEKESKPKIKKNSSD